MKEGIDALGKVTIRIRYQDRTYSGYAANTDIVVAAAQAYVNALNRLYTASHNLDEAAKTAQMV